MLLAGHGMQVHMQGNAYMGFFILFMWCVGCCCCDVMACDARLRGSL